MKPARRPRSVSRRPPRHLARHLHPGAWWLWALGLAGAASRTTNPLLLALLVAVAAYVVSARRSSAPWARSFGAFLRLGLIVVGIRVVFQVLFGPPIGGTVLFTLPSLDLPEWAAGVRVGGDVTFQSMVLATYQGLQLATILACVGAANALADPRRLLRSVPGALYEAGVALIVALSFAPRLVEDASRVRAAYRLRGHRFRGLRAVGRVSIPVLEGALERSIDLAAAMDSRGFGRRAALRPGLRRLSGTLVIGGLLGVCVGVYGLLDGGSPASLGPVVLAAGLALAAIGFALAGRRTTRTRYRPDPWALPEWLTALCGLAVAGAFTVAAARGTPGMNLQIVPLVVPDLPILPTLGVLAALLPAWLTPMTPRMVAQPEPPAGQRDPAQEVAA